MSQLSQINPNSTFKKRTIGEPLGSISIINNQNIPSTTTTTTTKVSYGLNQLAPLQSQSIQLNSMAQMTQVTPTIQVNPGVIHVGQPLISNTQLAPMITSNAIHSKDANAYLFTDPKLLSMMRADIQKY